MARAKLVIEDKEDGYLNVKATFDPPLKNNDEVIESSAQNLMMTLMEYMTKITVDGGDEEE